MERGRKSRASGPRPKYFVLERYSEISYSLRVMKAAAKTSLDRSTQMVSTRNPGSILNEAAIIIEAADPYHITSRRLRARRIELGIPAILAVAADNEKCCSYSRLML